MTKLDDKYSEKVISNENIVQATWFDSINRSIFLSTYINLVIERNKAGILDETSHGVRGLLTCLENVFYSAPRGGPKFWKDWKLWYWVAQSCENMPQSCVGLVNSLDNLQSGLAKLRAFLRLALQSKRLHLYLGVLFNATDVISFDMRADELNFPRIGQVDYASLLSFTNRYPKSNVPCAGYHLRKDVCKQCQEYVFKAFSSESQKQYLEDVVRDANKQILGYEDELGRLLDDNRRLRSAFDQLQTKLLHVRFQYCGITLSSALMHEEYAQRLRWLGFDAQVFPVRLDSQWQDISRPCHWWWSPVDWSAAEATEDLNDIPAAGTQPHASSSCPSSSFPPFPQKGNRLLTLTPRFVEGDPCVPSSECTDMAAIEATEDLDVVDLLYERGVAGSTSSEVGPLLRVECPRPQSSQFVIGEQEASECSEVYRLPGATDAITPSTNGSPLDLSQLLVTVKPSNTNYRARFSVPKTVVGGSSRRSPPQLDLLSELQQTDSSFPLTGLSSLASGQGGAGGGGGGGGEETEGACSTSDQVSDIVNEVAPEEETAFGSAGSGGDCGGYATTASSSRNTVLTSTSTIRPTNFSNSLASSPSINETACTRALLVETATEPPMGAFRRSTSDLPTTTTTIMKGATGCRRRCIVSRPSFTPTSPVPQLNS
ncbi:RUN domain-containing protein 3A [Taenia solium]|eukprot:TsM_000903600 transcript=TsM_000903600 gene=TsM_000903600